jgi:xanthine dehydrogenase YagR molybdenum-binding subunit
VRCDGKTVSKRGCVARVSIADAMRHGGVDRIEQEKSPRSLMITHTRTTRIRRSSPRLRWTEQLGVIRVTRVVSAVAGGRILNTKTGA